MKLKLCIYSQPNYFTSWTPIEAVLVQQTDRHSFKTTTVLNFVFFVMLKNQIELSAVQSCLNKKLLLSKIPTAKTFENRLMKKVRPCPFFISEFCLGKTLKVETTAIRSGEAYRVYAEDTFLPCDAGDARIFSKEMTHTDNQGDNEEQKAKRYYYHSDHLGSAQFVTDWKGRQYEHIEYTPYGELWIEEVAAGLDKLPFRFTGKELDEETGLYYYGARYLGPKYSRWLSGDPALNEYMAGSSVGEGGIYNTVNFNVYHYGGNNPIKYTDPTGNDHIAGNQL